MDEVAIPDAIVFKRPFVILENPAISYQLICFGCDIVHLLNLELGLSDLLSLLANVNPQAWLLDMHDKLLTVKVSST